MAIERPSALRDRPPLQHPLLVGLTVVLTPLLWVLFVASSNPHELVVGLVCSVVTLVFTLFVCHLSSSDLQFRPRDLAQAWRIPGSIVSDSVIISLVLVRDLLHFAPAGNLYRVCGFDTSAHDPVREARSILAIAYATTTPNSIVIGIDPAQSRMLFHQLKATPVPKMVRSLGAKA